MDLFYSIETGGRFGNLVSRTLKNKRQQIAGVTVIFDHENPLCGSHGALSHAGMMPRGIPLFVRVNEGSCWRVLEVLTHRGTI